MLYLALFLFLLAVILLSLSTRQRKAAGLPGGQIIYSDTSTWEPLEKPLYDNRLDLSGKPDYLIRQGNSIIPVEVKSSRIDQAPYDSHVFQLAAYCRLVEAEFGKRPTHGILHYPQKTFQINYTPELESSLVGLVIDIQSKKIRKEIHRSHESPERCARCGYQSTCDQRLH